MSTASTPIAFVTGASRGIGKATALRLADAGFDVAFTARTAHEGEGRTEVNSVRSKAPIVAVPGSLEVTEQEVRRRRRRALPIRMDLMDSDQVVDAARAVLSEWGRVNVLVNNAILTSGASMDRVGDLTAESMGRMMTANYIHQVLLIQQVLPAMLEAGAGRIVNMVSASARLDPRGPAGDGGWGIGYSASKAAFGRVAGGINAEHAPTVMAFNVDPGNVVTEKRKALAPKDPFEDRYGNEPPGATASVIAYLATSADAADYLGKWNYAPDLSKLLGLTW